MKRVLGWLALACLVFYVGSSPNEAADLAENLGGGLAEIFTNVGDFFVELSR
jgi:hypothetical protein